MGTKTIIGLVLLVAGAIALYFGLQAADSPLEQARETFTGNYSDDTMLHWHFAVSPAGMLHDSQEETLERQNAELLSLHHAALDLGGELGLKVLLQKIVDRAQGLLGARYGALSVIDREGGIEAFVTSGLSDEERQRMYYEDVFARLIPIGHEFYTHAVQPDAWIEIDTLEDLEAARLRFDTSSTRRRA